MNTPIASVNGAEIPVIGLGTWPMSGDEAVQAVSTAIAAGYRHIDTAAMYKNEADVGRGIREAGIARDELFVTTKVWADQLRQEDFLASARQSLDLLQMDQVDLLLIHWPPKDISVAEAVHSLNLAKAEGLTRHIGVSNFTSTQLEQAWQATEYPLVANQCEYHPALDQTTVLNACRDRGMAFTSYMPLSRGKVMDDPAIQSLAEKYNKTPGQIILRWHIQQPNVVAIPKSATPARIRENLAIFDFELTVGEMHQIHALSQPDGRMCWGDFAPDWD